jgi:hypothetical protein
MMSLRPRSARPGGRGLRSPQADMVCGQHRGLGPCRRDPSGRPRWHGRGPGCRGFANPPSGILPLLRIFRRKRAQPTKPWATIPTSGRRHWLSPEPTAEGQIPDQDTDLPPVIDAPPLVPTDDAPTPAENTLRQAGASTAVGTLHLPGNGTAVELARPRLRRCDNGARERRAFMRFHGAHSGC